MAVVDDGRGSMIEVLPRGTELREGPGEEDAIGVLGPSRRFTASHIAIDTVLDDAAVFAIGEREGWPMKYGRRAGGAVRVIEAWFEGCSMVMILTPQQLAAYTDAITVAKCRAMLSAPAPRKVPPRRAVPHMA